MSERPRTGPARDVPPPRPVGAAVAAETEGGVARAARLLADAVTGLLGNVPRSSAEGGARGTAGGLRDVIAAVAAAVTSGRAGSGGSGSAAGSPDDSSRAPGAVLGDLLAAAAPRLPIRDAARIRAASPGATDEEIADALVQRAARLTAAVGGATGGLSAAHWFAPPSMIALPLELAAETVLTAAVEIVLLGELHELYGRVPAGDARERAAAYLASWSAQRAVDRTGTAGLGSVLGAASFRAVRRRLGRRMARSAPAAAPFLVGAALGSRGNRRATETLARRVRDDLRRSS
ncbi:hypothetical protein [Blastococcus sp. TF02A-26]|uniref:hypothetical protein n=1 Tax=Blastococcus sp. TF02A-26 TaxID=2250577 RepID=UPI000DE99156|nr:hypothetical protein [Blastococcus sp. TF02A-26]RBY90585.1 hypothetical protein DQ240_00415 [Blastococcus sp. TF02A-26]